MRRTAQLSLLIALATSVEVASAQVPDATPSAASDGEQIALASVASRERPKRHYDYSRFKNGPRHVPRPRGKSLARAEALGIGSLTTTREILRGRIDPALAAEVPGTRPRTLLWPVVGGHFGRGFGYTRRVRTDLRHNGIDIGAPAGAVVRAAADGLVVYSDNTLRGMGNVVVVLHADGLSTLYAHNTRTTVQPGWRVRRGERIALVGQTGIARGPHLHFEVRRRGRLIDPARMMVGQRSDEVNGPLVELAGDAHDAKPPTSATDEPADDGSGAEQDADSSTEGPPEWPFQLGDRAAAREVLRRPPELDEASQARIGQRYSSLLWPLKGGHIEHGYQRRDGKLELSADPSAAIRAAADGVVVHAGAATSGRGHQIVMLHRGGWVTAYETGGEVAVTAGQQVERGEWIGHVASGTPDAPRLRFQWRVDGRPRDPATRFVGQPADR